MRRAVRCSYTEAEPVCFLRGEETEALKAGTPQDHALLEGRIHYIYDQTDYQVTQSHSALQLLLTNTRNTHSQDAHTASTAGRCACGNIHRGEWSRHMVAHP